MSNTIIFGGSGFLGSNFKLIYKKSLFSPSRTEINLTEIKNVLNYIDKIKPEIIIYCAGITKLDIAEEYKELTFKLNHETPVEIAKFCDKNNIKFVYISSDAVFDGNDKKIEFIESETPNPKSIYGKSKARAEFEILSSISNVTIFRLISLFGFGNRNFYLENFVKTLNEKKEYLAIENQIKNPLNVKIAAESIKFSLNENLKGIYHLGSIDSDTNFNFFKNVAIHLKLDHSLVKKITFNDFMKNKKAHRKKDSVLISEKFHKLSEHSILKNIEDSIGYLNLKDIPKKSHFK